MANFYTSGLNYWETVEDRWVYTGYKMPSIVTMAVSAVILEILFSVKEWPDHENMVRVHSRSLEMTPFDRLHTSSY